jgi:hypothetical protein
LSNTHIADLDLFTGQNHNAAQDALVEVPRMKGLGSLFTGMFLCTQQEPLLCNRKPGPAIHIRLQHRK